MLMLLVLLLVLAVRLDGGRLDLGDRWRQARRRRGHRHVAEIHCCRHARVRLGHESGAVRRFLVERGRRHRHVAIGRFEAVVDKLVLVRVRRQVTFVDLVERGTGLLHWVVLHRLLHRGVGDDLLGHMGQLGHSHPTRLTRRAARVDRVVFGIHVTVAVDRGGEFAT